MSSDDARSGSGKDPRCPCPFCDVPDREPYPFCRVCGKELNRCVVCGKPLPPPDTVCEECDS